MARKSMPAEAPRRMQLPNAWGEAAARCARRSKNRIPFVSRDLRQLSLFIPFDLKCLGS